MSTPATAPTLTRYISPRQLQASTGLSEATLWRLRQRGELPEPVRLSPGRVAWPEPVIVAWLTARAASHEERPVHDNAPGRGNGPRA